MRLPGLVLLIAITVAGCAKLEALFTPAPPPPSIVPAAPPVTPSPPEAPPVGEEPLPPPPLLSPQVGREDQDRLRREADNRIKSLEQTLAQIDQKKLPAGQQETSSTIQSFLVKAKEALSAQDYSRATNLADKAQILAEELVRGLR